MNNRFNHELRVKVCKEDLEKIRKRAISCGFNLSDYVRYVLLRTSIKVTIQE